MNNENSRPNLRPSHLIAIIPLLLGLIGNGFADEPTHNLPAHFSERPIQNYIDDAIFAFNHGQWDKAIVESSHVLVADPNNTSALDFRACSRLAKGEYSLAIRDFTKVILLEPLNVRAFLNRGNAYRANGESDRPL